MSKVKNEDLTSILRSYLLGLITCGDDIYPYRIAFNYARALVLHDKSQYAFIVTKEEFVDSLQEEINNNGLDEYMIVTTYEEPVFLGYDNSIVVFDSLATIMGDFSEDNIRNLFIMLNKLNQKFCQVLAITDYNMTNEEISKLCKLQPESFIYLSDHAAGTQITMPDKKLYFPRLVEDDITMTKEQEIKINSIIKDAPAPLNWINDEYRLPTDKYKDAEGFISPKKYFNIVYPYNVESAIKNNYDSIDALESIVNLFGPKEVLKYSPKFKTIIDDIVKTKTKDGIDNIFSRRVIFTAYPNVDDDNKDGDFGGDLLWIYLKDVEGLSVKCLYNYHSYEEKMAIMQDFNSGDTNILITNCYFIIPPLNVDHFHIVDSDLETAFNMIDVMFKNLGYGSATTSPSLDVHLHYVQRDKSEKARITYDSYDFGCLKDYILGLQEGKQKRFNEGWPVQRAPSGNGRYEIVIPKTMGK